MGLPHGRADALRERVPRTAHLDFWRLGHDESVQVSVYRPNQDSLERESSDCAGTSARLVMADESKCGNLTAPSR